MENNMEQPDNVALSKTQEEVGEPITMEISSSLENASGSNFGKFKDATSLYRAYTQLEKEFTKKSQKLAELLSVSKTENQNASNLKNSNINESGLANSSEPNQAESSNSLLNDEVNGNFNPLGTEDKIESSDKNGNLPGEDLIKSSLNSTSLAENSNAQEFARSEPVYKKESWQTKVSSFFASNPEAREYAKEISKIIMNDKHLSLSDNCLDYAYAMAIKSRNIKPASLLEDSDFINQITSNSMIKDKIINEYLSGIMSGQTNIKFISGEPNNISPTPPTNKPKNLKDASYILKQMLKA